MAETGGTFSESWYRIADQRAALRPHLHVRRQFYRGERWYVIHDPINNQFFRLRSPAYDFVSRLNLKRTIEQAWQECLAANPERAPGQEDALRLLAQLYAANLLYSDLPADSAKLFERYQQRRDREIKSRLLNIMFARIPLLDPDRFLKSALPLIKLVFSPLGGLVWLFFVVAGMKVALDHADTLREQGQSILAPDNWFLLYLGFVLVKTVHEFGHAIMCRRFGGEVHTMGIMFMVFTPMPYVDATSSWSFRSRWHRVLVGLGGMIPELFLAAGLMFVWANTGAGTVHSLAYNMMFVASVSTLLFNANPLMRFDGYYILSDLLDIPNLYFRANQQLIYLIERYAFGCEKATSPAHSRREAWWLGVYGFAGHIYRIFVFAVILFFLSKRYLIVGVIMAVVCGVAWVVVPLVKLVQYLATSPRLERQRVRATAVCAGTAAIVLLFLELVPFPNHFRAPGVLQAEQYTIIVNAAPGSIQELLVPPGSRVERGQPLLQLRDPELEFELVAARAQLAESEAQELRALQEQTADLLPIRRRREVVEKHIHRLEEQQAALKVRAPHAGQWIAPEVDRLSGAWFARGTPLGQVINAGGFYFSAIVSEKDASRLFTREIRHAEIRLRGQAGRTLSVTGQKIIPVEHQVLPSAALGWRGGGEVPVELHDASGVRAAEPFFQVRATVSPSEEAMLLHGRSGKIRFQLAPEPLLHQWVRALRQLLQKQYGV